MDDQRCVWCGEPVEPACQGVVVIAEDERCYEGYDERPVDRTPRGLPQRYGHSLEPCCSNDEEGRGH